MSRSFKKNPMAKAGVDSEGKSFANDKVKNFYKNNDFIDSSRSYDKKLYSSWDIVDYKAMGPSYADFLESERIKDPMISEKVVKRKYHKYWINK